MALLSPWTALMKITTVPSFMSHKFKTGFALRWKEDSFEGKMYRYVKPAIVSLVLIFTVSVGLLQEQTFERVIIKYGKVIKSSQTRSVMTCVDSCLQHYECRYVRCTKSSKVCELFGDVLLYYGSVATLPPSDVDDFKKVFNRFLTVKQILHNNDLTKNIHYIK